MFSNDFLPGCAGVNTGHYQSTALVWFYSFSVPSSYHQLLGCMFQKKLIVMTVFVKRPAKGIIHPPSFPFSMGFSCTVVFGIE